MKNTNRTIRSTALGALAVAAMISLSACGGAADAEKPSAAENTAPLFKELPEKVQKAGTINVASNVEYPPFESFDTDGTTIVGIDREIADELEKQLGVTMKFDNIAFDAIIPGLSSARYDMAMSAMSDTVERQKVVNFLDYFSAGGGIMTSTANASTYKTLDDLCGTHVGIVKGTTEDADAAAASKKCEDAGKEKIEVTIFAGQNQAVLALESDRVDAFLVDSTSGSVVAAGSKGALAMGERYQDLAFGIVFPKDQEQLMGAIQKGLEAIKADGSYEKILTSYDMADHAMDSFPVNGVKE
ncbi:ABC transporter substrate-binding protein [Paeniglutamicibacter cryotolerans]|uniref:Polar amino acid transport system substrate-binding protein n=1 Tax=Paeniglutamicibacter cryotolerans TaxID=670079 RepID=A0A839QI33_9MICC|nr:ABC transporter substrate-binding protein [Paeniglutamicibacter cryotolerans]MBB2995437.1 polar amino acid transport system substrate-binding protein [Paeniglutamicibacter cryotolerans]